MAYECPYCNTTQPPTLLKQVSGSGWIVFVLLLLFCFPLCWLPFVIDGCKEIKRECPNCHTPLN